MHILFAIIIIIYAPNVTSAAVQSPLKFTNNIQLFPTVDGFQPQESPQVLILGGKPARSRQFPYQVGLFVPIEGSTTHGSWCGGTLISNRFVLTAAHCIVKSGQMRTANSVNVYLGATDFNSIEPGRKKVKVPGWNIIKHPGYGRNEDFDDIALIELPQSVRLNAYIQIADLPKRSHKKDDLVGQTIVSSGWGRIGSGGTSAVLQYMQTKVIEGRICSRAFGQEVYNDKKQICINAPGRSVCQGDSGGPHVLFDRSSGRKTVIGITSYGASSCEAGHPQVLTRVSYYLNWIHQHTGIPIRN